MYRREHTLFQTLVDNKGFEDGIISGPKGRLGTILRVKITETSLVVVYWRDNSAATLPLPIIVPMMAIHKVSEEGEDSFHAKITEIDLWVLCPPTSPDPLSLPPWGE